MKDLTTLKRVWIIAKHNATAVFPLMEDMILSNLPTNVAKGEI